MFSIVALIVLHASISAGQYFPSYQQAPLYQKAPLYLQAPLYQQASQYRAYPQAYPVQNKQPFFDSLYEIQKLRYPIGRANKVPAYTAVIKNIDLAINLVKKHLLLPLDQQHLLRGGQMNNSPPIVQYVTILTAFNELVDQLVKVGLDAYPKIYQSVVTNTIIMTSGNPKPAAEALLQRIEKTENKLSVIRSLIEHKQHTECKVPTSDECDAIIHTAVQQSKNPDLQKQAALLAALHGEVLLFDAIYEPEFVQVSNTQGASAYLVLKGEQRLKSLVIEAVRARQIADEIPEVEQNLLNNPVLGWPTPKPLLRNRQTPDITLVPDHTYTPPHALRNKQTPDITLVPDHTYTPPHALRNKQTPDITLVPDHSYTHSYLHAIYKQ